MAQFSIRFLSTANHSMYYICMNGIACLTFNIFVPQNILGRKFSSQHFSIAHSSSADDELKHAWHILCGCRGKCREQEDLNNNFTLIAVLGCLLCSSSFGCPTTENNLILKSVHILSVGLMSPYGAVFLLRFAVEIAMDYVCERVYL